jgi:hypothetical protein
MYLKAVGLNDQRLFVADSSPTLIAKRQSAIANRLDALQ